MKYFAPLLLVPSLCLAVPDYKNAGAHHDAHVEWGYAGDEGKGKFPEHWDEVAPLCRKGKRQSPINIPLRSLRPAKDKKSVPTLKVDYREDEFAVFHNRHTVQSTAQGKLNSVQFAGKTYVLKQFHYHKKSEHLLDGEQFAAEIHFVHEAGPNDLLVIGVFADPSGKGESLTAELHRILEKYPGKTNRYEPANLKINPGKLLPADKTFVTYPGSLTTPPCLETVTWVVMPSVMSHHEVDSDFLQQKGFDVGFKNFRPHFAAENRKLTLGTGQ